ncbi:hypothetical protein [uncultured Ruminococcus sp.]|uniref:hypothetical protein n=1 Tax=uncultured Ruminococcus sp. TaxID=165186 RepID=UPI0025D160D4|nr:hypothetical protein [uncultured Ruminococcus sp.]
MKISRYHINQAISLIISVLMILCFYSVYNHSVTKIHYNYILAFFVAIVPIFTLQKKSKLKKAIILATIMFLLLSIPVLNNILINRFAITYNLDLLVKFCFIFPISIMLIEQGCNLLKSAYNVTCVVAIVSLVFWILVNFLGIKKTGIIYCNWAEYNPVYDSYFSIFFTQQKIHIFNHLIYKNMGFFVEPPIYGTILTFFFAYGISKGESRKKNILLALTTLTTFSIGSISVLMMLVVLRLVSMLSKTKYFKIVSVIIIPFFVLLSAILLYKLYKFKSVTGSASIYCRIDDYLACYKTFKEHILFGCGLDNVEPIIKNMSFDRKSNTGLSNSFGVLAAQNGIYGLLLFCTLTIYCMYKLIRTEKKNIYIFIGFNALYVLNIMTYSNVLMLYMLYFITLKNPPSSKLIKKGDAL